MYVSNSTLYFAKKIPSEREPREILELSTDELTSDEFEEAAKKLGSTVLGILSLWHPEVLKRWGIGSESDESVAQIPNDFDVAMHLISKSVFDKTKVYVQAIDTLLSEQSIRTKAGHEFFTESWPTIRNRLEKFM